MASQITSLTIVYSAIGSGADQRKHQSSASLAFVRGIHWWTVNSPHKGLVTRKMFPFDDTVYMGHLTKKTYQVTSNYLCNKYILGCPELHKELWPVIDRHLDSTTIILFGGMGSHFVTITSHCVVRFVLSAYQTNSTCIGFQLILDMLTYISPFSDSHTNSNEITEMKFRQSKITRCLYNQPLGRKVSTITCAVCWDKY